MADFDPVDFYHQASACYAADSSKKQVTCRSVISRAYYAAFLAARKKAGIKAPPKDMTIHELVALYYANKPDGVQKGIGNRLQQLRVRRNDADYELGILCVPNYASTALIQSEQVLVALGYLTPPATTR